MVEIFFFEVKRTLTVGQSLSHREVLEVQLFPLGTRVLTFYSKILECQWAARPEQEGSSGVCCNGLAWKQKVDFELSKTIIKRG